MSNKLDSKVPLVGFSGEHSWPIREVPLEITIGDAPFTRTETLNFVIVRSTSPHNLLFGRTTMQKIGERSKRLKEVSPWETEEIFSCTDAEERIIVNDKYPKQTVIIGRHLLANFKEKLQDLLKSNADVFAWTHADMTGIPRTITIEGKPFNMEHKLNEYKHIKPIKQKRRGLDLNGRRRRRQNNLFYRRRNIMLSKNAVGIKKRRGHFEKGKRIFSMKEDEKAFQKMKKFMEILPTLTAPIKGEVLVMVLQGAELNYPTLEKVILALIYATRRLRRYFQAHTVIVPTNEPIKKTLVNPKKSGRVAKWAIELGEYDIEFRERDPTAKETPKDFAIEMPTEDKTTVRRSETKTKNNAWRLYTDRASSFDGSGAGLMLISLEGKENTYALRFEFQATNNEAEYEALMAGLRITQEMEIRSLAIFADS
ncbi:reverse transcriptase domain-containing protein [Tanacetum coccineum]